MTQLQATLTALRTVRLEAKAIAAQIETLEAPYKSAMASATGALRAQLTANKTADESLSASAQEQYLTLARERAAAIAGNPDSPAEAVALVPGCSVKWLTFVQLDDPQTLPRFVLVPDTKLIKDALVAAIEVPGAQLKQLPAFAFAKEPKP
ncbi:MAG: hypothetical protein WC359_13105 [Dehalococcoidia bacterium]